MAYDNPGPMGGGDAMPDMGGSDMPHGEGETTTLGPELTGNQKFKAGDILELVATADTDENGQTTFKYNTEGKGAGESGESWEDEARKSLSPRAKEQEAM